MLSRLVPRLVHPHFQIDNTMRILSCLLLTWSVIATDAQAQTAKESQATAVAAIRKLGGNVTFDEKSPGKPLVSVDLSSTKVTDAGLVHLKGLTPPNTVWPLSCGIHATNAFPLHRREPWR